MEDPKQKDEKPTGEGTEELEETGRSLLGNLIGQLRVGMDLSKVTLPTFILEPKSFLEKLSDFQTHSELVMAVTQCATPEERFIATVRWYLSGFYIRPKGVKKPYNPLLGEFYRCNWDNGDRGKTFYYAEQVSHHPPMSAIYLSNRKAGLVGTGYIIPRSKFLGNSVASILEGHCTLYLLALGEEYHITFPSIYGRGILFGTLLMETVGQVTITCEKTGYKAELDFKAKGYFGGSYNQVDGVITKDKKKTHTLTGHWDKKIELKKQGEKKTSDLFNIQTIGAPHQRQELPIDAQDPMESQRLWLGVSKAIRTGDQTVATEEKTALEDRQRAETAARLEKNETYQPRHFFKNDKDEWVYKHQNLKPWDPEVDVEEVEENGKIYTKTKADMAAAATAASGMD